jgi:hypothetical protein
LHRCVQRRGPLLELLTLPEHLALLRKPVVLGPEERNLGPKYGHPPQVITERCAAPERQVEFCALRGTRIAPFSRKSSTRIAPFSRKSSSRPAQGLVRRARAGLAVHSDLDRDPIPLQCFVKKHFRNAGS